MNESSHNGLPFGLLELDSRGAVIRYSPASERRQDVQARDILGRHFFTEVVTDEHVRDFQARFQLFMSRGQTIDRFSTSFDSEEGEVKVQFLLARVEEGSEAESDHLALVRIMPETSRIPASH